MAVKAAKEAANVLDDGAKAVLKQNLRALMEAHPVLANRKALAARTGVSARTVGGILKDGGNPNLANLEALALAYKLEVWELLMPGLDVSKIAIKVSPEEAKLHKTIEDAMRKLGVTQFQLIPKKPPKP